jgi:hypothetical protein
MNGHVNVDPEILNKNQGKLDEDYLIFSKVQEIRDFN